jgi:DNA-binding SARP family transcriptional activator
VLAWLARVALAGRFWPDVVAARARACLRNALWVLRRAAGAELFDASRDRVGLHPAVAVDVAAFAEHGRAGRHAEAVALYRGELLSGLEGEWVHEAREAHRRQLAAPSKRWPRRPRRRATAAPRSG